MADSNFRGPIGAMGSLEVQSGTAATIEVMDGPSYFYQTFGMLDPRAVPFLKDGTGPARVPSFLSNGDFWSIHARPQASNATTIATNQVATSLVAMALATVQPSNPNVGCQFIAIDVPILPQGTSNVTTANIALDFGFITGTATANSSTLAVSDSTKLTLGQWICLGGGGASNASSFFTQIQTISTSNITSVTISPLPPAATSSGPICWANLFGAGLLPFAT